jgi:hypothetical protein
MTGRRGSRGRNIDLPKPGRHPATRPFAAAC